MGLAACDGGVGGQCFWVTAGEEVGDEFESVFVALGASVEGDFECGEVQVVRAGSEYHADAVGEPGGQPGDVLGDGGRCAYRQDHGASAAPDAFGFVQVHGGQLQGVVHVAGSASVVFGCGDAVEAESFRRFRHGDHGVQPFGRIVHQW